MLNMKVSPARMYTGILRQDITAEEQQAIDACPQTSRMFRKVQAGVWHPTPEARLLYDLGKLTGDMLVDVEFHLHVDKCVKCLKIGK